MFGKHSRTAKSVRVINREWEREWRQQGRHDQRVADEAFAQMEVLTAAIDLDAPAAIYDRLCTFAEWECLLLNGECDLAHADMATIEDALETAWDEEERLEYEAEEFLRQRREDREYEAEWDGVQSWLPLLSEVGGVSALDFGFHVDDTNRYRTRIPAGRWH